jgi:hypothetical protein
MRGCFGSWALRWIEGAIGHVSDPSSDPVRSAPIARAMIAHTDALIGSLRKNLRK